MKSEDIQNLVYPGGYVPLIVEEEVLTTIRNTRKNDNLAPVNVTEIQDSYRIEMAIPGVKRENFLVYSNKNVLTVCVLNKESLTGKPESFQIHEFDYNCFERHIILPPDADTDFALAEYRSGLLQIYVP